MICICMKSVVGIDSRLICYFKGFNKQVSGKCYRQRSIGETNSNRECLFRICKNNF
jgi:hypothetical protein